MRKIKHLDRDSSRSEYHRADLLQIIDDALRPLERLATEEARGNIGRRKIGLPKETKAMELWERAKAAIARHS